VPTGRADLKPSNPKDGLTEVKAARLLQR